MTSASMPAFDAFTSAAKPAGAFAWRQRLGNLLPHSLARMLHWEFWPTWLAYIPLVPVYIFLAARYRSFSLPLIANTAPSLSMLAGESKFEILQSLPAGRIATAFLADPCTHAPSALSFHIKKQLAIRGWSFPFILKPDRGCRGSGVRLIRTPDQLEVCISHISEPMLIQQYHPGPCEVGVFYAHRPSQATGQILSVTRKVFPSVTGDGVHTLSSLIERHARLRLQYQRFAARHSSQLHTIPALGQIVPLCIAGNRCQGTLFRDGSDLITPELHAAIDAIARETPGFHFGRFDIRCESESDLKQGKGICIIELNGISSESTNVYDPDVSIWCAYATWTRSLAEAFAIGAEQRARGIVAPTAKQTWRLITAARREKNLDGLSD